MKEFKVQLQASTGAVTRKVPVFTDHTLIGGYAAANANNADADLVLSFKVGATTVGTCTIPDTTEVGVPVAIVMDTTLATRKNKITATAPLTVVSDGAQTASIGFDCLIQLDEFACPRD